MIILVHSDVIATDMIPPSIIFERGDTFKNMFRPRQYLQPALFYVRESLLYEGDYNFKRVKHSDWKWRFIIDAVQVQIMYFLVAITRICVVAAEVAVFSRLC